MICLFLFLFFSNSFQEQGKNKKKLDELIERNAELEDSVEQYVGLCSSREKALNEKIAFLEDVIREKDSEIAEFEEDEELDERIEKLKVNVLGIVEEAKLWNAKEKNLLEQIQEQTLVVVHLKEREKKLSNQEKEWQIRVQKLEVRMRSLEEELEEWMMRHQTVKEEANLLRDQLKNGVSGGGDVKDNNSQNRIAELERLLKEQMHTAEVFAEKYENERRNSRSSVNNRVSISTSQQQQSQPPLLQHSKTAPNTPNNSSSSLQSSLNNNSSMGSIPNVVPSTPCSPPPVPARVKVREE